MGEERLGANIGHVFCLPMTSLMVDGLQSDIGRVDDVIERNIDVGYMS